MRNTEEYHRKIARRALEFMRTRAEEDISVAGIAAYAGCSPVLLRGILRKATGKSVVANLQSIRIEQAKLLLTQAPMTVTEAMLSVGFQNPASFGRLFRRLTGMSPSLYRKIAEGAAIPAESPNEAGPGTPAAAFRDDFTSPSLGACWKAAFGQWAIASGFVEGKGSENFELRLDRLLPENFCVEFEVRLPATTRFHVHLRNADGTDSHAHFEFRPAAAGGGVLRIRNRAVLSNPLTGISPASWHDMRIEMNGNSLTAQLDGVTVFAHRDIFPAPFSDRCRLALAGYASTIQIRRFALLDLGFSPFVPTVRQGDALFNAGLFDEAKDFYLRHLLPNLPPETDVELRFKIGMCFLRQGRYDECRQWTGSLARATDIPFWQDECRLLMLQVEAESMDMDTFARLAREAFDQPHLRNVARPILVDGRQAALRAGFLARALHVADLRLKLEKDDLMMVATARDRVAYILKNTRRFAEAERHYRALAGPAFPPEVRHDACVSLSDICLARHRFAEARRWIAQARMVCGDGLPESGWRVFQEAVCLWVERKTIEAVTLLLRFHQDYPQWAGWGRQAKIQAAEWLACLNEPEKARSLVRRLRQEDAVSDDEFRGYEMVSHLRSADYADMAERLLSAARRRDNRISQCGQDAIAAGILLELAGRPDDAVRVWNETARRFPANRCYFWSSLARALADGKPDRLETMKLFASVRSEMFCLAGLLYQKRGNRARARQLFALSVKEHPSFGWPAVLAENMLRADHGAE